MGRDAGGIGKPDGFGGVRRDAGGAFERRGGYTGTRVFGSGEGWGEGGVVRLLGSRREGFRGMAAELGVQVVVLSSESLDLVLKVGGCARVRQSVMFFTWKQARL